MIRWNRSNDGFVTSKCGFYEITPLYCGCVKPQAYELWFYPNGINKPGRVKVSSYDSSQKVSKRNADWHEEGQKKA